MENVADLGLCYSLSSHGSSLAKMTVPKRCRMRTKYVNQCRFANQSSEFEKMTVGECKNVLCKNRNIQQAAFWKMGVNSWSKTSFIQHKLAITIEAEKLLWDQRTKLNPHARLIYHFRFMKLLMRKMVEDEDLSICIIWRDKHTADHHEVNRPRNLG